MNTSRKPCPTAPSTRRITIALVCLAELVTLAWVVAIIVLAYTAS